MLQWMKISEHEWASGPYTIIRTFRKTADYRPRLDKPKFRLYLRGEDTGRFGPTLKYAQAAAETLEESHG